MKHENSGRRKKIIRFRRQEKVQEHRCPCADDIAGVAEPALLKCEGGHCAGGYGTVVAPVTTTGCNDGHCPDVATAITTHNTGTVIPSGTSRVYGKQHTTHIHGQSGAALGGTHYKHSAALAVINDIRKQANSPAADALSDELETCVKTLTALYSNMHDNNTQFGTRLTDRGVNASQLVNDTLAANADLQAKAQGPRANYFTLLSKLQNVALQNSSGSHHDCASIVTGINNAATLGQRAGQLSADLQNTASNYSQYKCT